MSRNSDKNSNHNSAFTRKNKLNQSQKQNNGLFDYLMTLRRTLPTFQELDLDLGRIYRLLARLGNPHVRMPPVIHVAGTNGKGSVVATTRAILEHAGYGVHVYTSPHLVQYNERIRIGQRGGKGRLVGDRELMQAIQQVLHCLSFDCHVTFFEVCTVAAFCLFASNPADFTVIEVGLGGKLDATNVIPSPLASVITSISLDHESELGNNIISIAKAKAGIIKAGAKLCISHPQDPKVADIIEDKAKSLNVPCLIGSRHWNLLDEESNFRITCKDGEDMVFPAPLLFGKHQIVNASTAIMAIKELGLASVNTIREGLSRVYWPGRMEKLNRGKLFAFLPQGSEIWLDGGHNPGGAEVIVNALKILNARDPRPLYMIIGMAETKDATSCLKVFSQIECKMFTVGLGITKASNDLQLIQPTCHIIEEISWEHSSLHLAKIAQSIGIDVESTKNYRKAFARINYLTQDEQVPPRVLCCGSLYLIGKILEANGTIPI